MRYLSLCSGIEAASVAWHPLGWQPVAFAEIEAFPSAVLAHHYPTVPNWGDMTKFKDWPDATVDVLVGGTPCQSFSVAGLRKGLADPRGNLALTYLATADRYRPEWVVWENVPGVLSSDSGRDFGAFLGGLGQLGYGFAYRVLDAQFVRVDGFRRAVPQRRRRVFVVGHSGDWRRAAAVLFERESLSRHSAPRREAGQGVAGTVAPCLESGGNRTGGTRPPGTTVDTAEALIASTGEVSHCLNAGGMGRIDYETETMIAHALRAEGFDASEDGTGRGTPLVPVRVAPALTSNYGKQPDSSDTSAGPMLVPICFSAKDHGADAMEKLSPTLLAGGHAGSHANAGVMPAIAFNGRMDPVNGDVPGAIDTDPSTTCVAFDMRGREGGAQFEGPHDTANIRAASGGSSRSYVAGGWAVRRLTPTECERLQGFPDGYTAIPYRNKPAADGPRYKALGNSMAVNCMRWLGRRIEAVSAILDARKDAA